MEYNHLKAEEVILDKYGVIKRCILASYDPILMKMYCKNCANLQCFCKLTCGVFGEIFAQPFLIFTILCEFHKNSNEIIGVLVKFIYIK